MTQNATGGTLPEQQLRLAPDGSDLTSAEAEVPVQPVQPAISVEVEIESLLPGDSPRLDGQNHAHVKLLAEASVRLPPIRVHRQTMRVIDGMHRLQAAVLQGRCTIDVVYFDGDETAAFLLAVEANTTHGLPLTLSDRRVAAAKIVSHCPMMSDRAIAAKVGLSPKTVGVIRRDEVAGLPAGVRVGCDGRVRPVGDVQGRETVRQILRERPGASLREVAALAGVSPNTVRRVRADLSPVDEAGSAGESVRGTVEVRPSLHRARPVTANRELHTVLAELQRDPSLRFTQGGRSLLRWLVAHRIEESDWREFAERVPPHCSDVIAEVASRYSEGWRRLASALTRPA